MKKIKIIYWISTILIAGLMLFSGIPDLLSVPDAVAFFKTLGYPAYLLPFLGVAKTLAAITILVPGFNRLKEWAYAGITYDLLGAAYSGVASGASAASGLIFFAAIFAVLAVSYIYHHKKLKATGDPTPVPAL
jgi:uncharacterized membrane protein YphA (DoxX/SURF4 family)